MADEKSNHCKAFLEGQEAVRRKPYHAPRNPYDEESDPGLYDGWDDGADSAGINDIYTNGILNRSER